MDTIYNVTCCQLVGNVGGQETLPMQNTLKSGFTSALPSDGFSRQVFDLVNVKLLLHRPIIHSVLSCDCLVEHLWTVSGILSINTGLVNTCWLRAPYFNVSRVLVVPQNCPFSDQMELWSNTSRLELRSPGQLVMVKHWMLLIDLSKLTSLPHRVLPHRPAIMTALCHESASASSFDLVRPRAWVTLTFLMHSVAKSITNCEPVLLWKDLSRVIYVYVG